MYNSPTQLNNTSNGGDFQPSTQNPQPSITNNPQTPVTNVQPVQSSGGTSAEQLYQHAERQPNLTVQTDGYSLNSLVSVPAEGPRSNNGLLTVTIALAIILLAVVVVRRYWRQIPATTLFEDNELAEAESTSTAVIEEATSQPISQKTKPKKKKTGARKKRRSKKR